MNNQSQRGALSVKEWNALGVDLRGKQSGQITTTCPFCSKNRKKKSDPCMSVQVETGVYNCHHCGETGNIHTFKSTKKEYVIPEWNNRTDLSDSAVKWFEGRGISQTTLKIMKISEGEEWMPQTKNKENTIQFNYFKEGKLINIKFRDGRKNFKLVKDAEKIWYNYDSIQPEVVIVEGEMDVLSFIEAGIKNCISVPNGANNFEFGELDPEKVIIAVDNDEPGHKLKNELIRRFGAEICYLIDWGEYKDANEYLVKRGKMSLSNILSKAIEVPVEGIIQTHQLYEQLTDLYKNGLKPGLKINHTNLNKYITYETGRLMIVTGIPGHGKSEFVDEILVQLNILHGWRIGYFTPENFPIQLHMSKLIAKLSGKWMNYLTINELDEYAGILDENFFWVMPEEDYTIDTILAKAKYLVKKFGIKAFVIDPWNTLEYTAPKGMTETLYISKTLGYISNFARRNDILMVIVAHPKKMEKKDKIFETPNLYSISGSSHFFNKADYGITVYRHENNDVEIHIQKVKFRHLGSPEMVPMRNDPHSGRYKEFESISDNIDQLPRKDLF